METGQLRDYLRMYLNKAGTAGDEFARSGKGVHLDQIDDATANVTVLTAELRRREGYEAIEETPPRLQELTERFFARQSAGPPR
jgi:hypothetical protein